LWEKGIDRPIEIRLTKAPTVFEINNHFIVFVLIVFQIAGIYSPSKICFIFDWRIYIHYHNNSSLHFGLVWI